MCFISYFENTMYKVGGLEFLVRTLETIGNNSKTVRKENTPSSTFDT